MGGGYLCGIMEIIQEWRDGVEIFPFLVSTSLSIKYKVQLEDDLLYTHASDIVSFKYQGCALIVVCIDCTTQTTM